MLAANLTAQVRNIANVTTAVANGDLSQKITVDARGEILELKNTINVMVDQLRSFAAEVTRVAKEVGTEGKLGGQAEVRGVSGTWKDLTDNVNVLAANLTTQVRNIAKVTTAVAKGDLSQKITVDAKGEILELKNTINTMVDTLNSFAAEVTRVAKEVGTEGKLGGQADVKGVSGTWKDLTDNVNAMASNLTVQLRDVSKVTTAIANGDLTQKITVDVKGEILQIKNAINKMVDQLNSFAAEVTRVAREVGTEGKLGGQAEVKGVSGTWKDLTDNVNIMASNLTKQVRGIVKVVTAVANGDLSQKFVLEAKGEVAALAETINNMTDTLRVFADQVTLARARSRHRRQARSGSQGAGRRGRVEGPHGQREHHGLEPDEAGARHREGRDGGRERRSLPQVRARGARRGRRAGRDDQQHDRHAAHVRRSGDLGGSRSGHRGQAGRSGQGAWRRGHLARPDGQREPARAEPHLSGARHRRGLHGGRQGRPHALDHGRSAGRGRGPQGQHQPDDWQLEGHDPQEPGAGLAEDQPGALLQHDAGAAQHRVGGAAHHVGAHAARGRAARRVLPDGLGPPGRAPAAADRELRLRQPPRPEQRVSAEGEPDRPVRVREEAHLALGRARELHHHHDRHG